MADKSSEDGGIDIVAEATRHASVMVERRLAAVSITLVFHPDADFVGMGVALMQPYHNNRRRIVREILLRAIEQLDQQGLPEEDRLVEGLS